MMTKGPERCPSIESIDVFVGNSSINIPWRTIDEAKWVNISGHAAIKVQGHTWANKYYTLQVLIWSRVYLRVILRRDSACPNPRCYVSSRCVPKNSNLNMVSTVSDGVDAPRRH